METSCTAKKLLLLELFNQYFPTISPCRLDRRTIDRNNQTKEITWPCVLNVQNLREQDVYKALYTVDASKATGSDGIPDQVWFWSLIIELRSKRVKQFCIM